MGRRKRERHLKVIRVQWEGRCDEFECDDEGKVSLDVPRAKRRPVMASDKYLTGGAEVGVPFRIPPCVGIVPPVTIAGDVPSDPVMDVVGALGLEVEFDLTVVDERFIHAREESGEDFASEFLSENGLPSQDGAISWSDPLDIFYSGGW
jgi:hypothetical protein